MTANIGDNTPKRTEFNRTQQ